MITVEDNVEMFEMKELRERVAHLITKSYFVIRIGNPSLSIIECEQKAIQLIQDIIKEAI